MPSPVQLREQRIALLAREAQKILKSKVWRKENESLGGWFRDYQLSAYLKSGETFVEFLKRQKTHHPFPFKMFVADLDDFLTSVAEKLFPFVREETRLSYCQIAKYIVEDFFNATDLYRFYKKKYIHKEYCERCKEVTPHKTTAVGFGEGAGNSEVECIRCGTRKRIHA